MGWPSNWNPVRAAGGNGVEAAMGEASWTRAGFYRGSSCFYCGRVLSPRLHAVQMRNQRYCDRECYMASERQALSESRLDAMESVRNTA